jgi:hypothetical protein
MIIPKTFKLANRTYNVRLADSPIPCDGYTVFDDAQITLSQGMSRPLAEHTYLHEVVHCITNAMGRQDLNEDEGFVDAFSGLLHQILITQKGDLFT